MGAGSRQLPCEQVASLQASRRRRRVGPRRAPHEIGAGGIHGCPHPAHFFTFGVMSWAGFSTVMR